MTLKIDVYADVVCPWCYVGKRRLAKALELTGLRDAAQVRWLPFELNPGLPPEGIGRRAYLSAKFGPGYAAAEERLSTIGRFENIPFDFARIVLQPNTLNAHRLIRWAEKRSRQDEAAEGLFRAHFVEGRDIGKAPVLTDVGAACGLPKDDVERFLASNELTAEIKEDEEVASRAGIKFVPFFLVNGKPAIRGAEDADVMAGVLREAAGPVSTQNTV
jgi:predicted DsbA family dithiol-disulfide isomerase